MTPRLAYWGRSRVAGWPAREFLALYGVEIPWQVKLGKELQIPHRGFGLVVHPNTTIGDRVTLYQQVTVGRYDVHRPFLNSDFISITIEDDVMLMPGCKILGGPGVTTVGQGTIVAANAVLRNSTGSWEVWAGVPARLIRKRSTQGFSQK